MWMQNMDSNTIIVVSIAAFAAAVVLFTISFCVICKWCCKKKKEKKEKSNNKEELDRFLCAEESDEVDEDDIVKLKDEGTFHHITLIEETDSDVVSHKSGDDGQSVHLELQRRTPTPVYEDEETVVIELVETTPIQVPLVASIATGTPPDTSSSLDIEPAQVAKIELTPIELPPTDLAPSEIAPSEIAQSEIAPSEIAPSEIAPSEIAPSEIAPSEIAPTEIAPTEIAPTEIAPTEIAPDSALAANIPLSVDSNLSLYSAGSTTSITSPGSVKKGASSKSKRKSTLLRKASITNEFSLNAALKISLQYIESIKCLKGEISSISGLNFEVDETPDEVSFHLRFVPSKKFHIMTKYKPVGDCSDINLTFTMGPVRKDELIDNQLRIKLYGRKTQRLTRSSCFGECSYNLIEIIDKPIPSEFEENVQQTTSKPSYSSDSDGFN